MPSRQLSDDQQSHTTKHGCDIGIFCSHCTDVELTRETLRSADIDTVFLNAGTADGGAGRQMRTSLYPASIKVTFAQPRPRHSEITAVWLSLKKIA